MNFGTKLRESFSALSTELVGWDDVLAQTMFALATREHAFWLSSPGRAKSWAARMVFSLFPDARLFSIQVTKDMMPSAIFGSEIAKEYIDNGREIFNLDGGICTANFVFLDEFLDGPDFLVRSINSVLNERLFERKDQKVAVPLHTGIMTTNFNRYGTALEAVRDRMMCKAIIPTVNGIVDRMGMYDSYLEYAGTVPPLPQLSYEQLMDFADTVEDPKKVVVGDGVRLLHGYLIQSFARKRVIRERERLQNACPDRDVTDEEVQLDPITPRTEAKLNDFSRAAALLNGRDEVHAQDLRALRYGLITLGSESADDLAWTETCDEVLPRNSRQLKRIKELAAIARRIREIKRRGNGFTDIVLETAGKAETYTRVTVQELLDRIAGGESGAVAGIAQELKAEIRELGRAPSTTKFPWTGDWK